MIPLLLWLGTIIVNVVLWRLVAKAIKKGAVAKGRQESLIGMSRRYDDLRRELALLAWAEATTGANEAAIVRARHQPRNGVAAAGVPASRAGEADMSKAELVFVVLLVVSVRDVVIAVLRRYTGVGGDE